jgi:phosphoglycerate dehydrogenase-like enzyme
MPDVRKALIFINWPVRAWSIPDTHAAAIAAAFPDVEFVRVFTLEDAARAIVDVDVTFTPRLTAEMVRSATRLRWVHSPAAAVEGLLPLAELADAGVVVSNSKGIQAIPIAEHVMGGLLVLSRKFDRLLAAQQQHRWIQNDLVEDWPWLLHGRRMTIVGLGTIGVEIAKRAHAFGMHVTGVRRQVTAEHPDFVDRVVGPELLDDALTNCDVLVLAAPGVASTHQLIGASQIARLNRGAVLVNVARAAIVNDAAMRDALGTGQLGGAVLDVFEREPLDPTDALWTMPNVVVTPHSAGFRATHWDDVAALYRDNLRRYLNDQPLRNVVDLTAGY